MYLIFRSTINNCFAASLLPTHNKGKKHQKLLNLKQERENSSKKSIYVRGFQNSGSIEEDLAKYFNVYGKVSNIFLDKDKVPFRNSLFFAAWTYSVWCHSCFFFLCTVVASNTSLKKSFKIQYPNS